MPAVVGAVAPLRFPQRALATETRALERVLLGDVLHVGRGLDPVRRGVSELEWRPFARQGGPYTQLSGLQ